MKKKPQPLGKCSLSSAYAKGMADLHFGIIDMQIVLQVLDFRAGGGSTSYYYYYH